MSRSLSVLLSIVSLSIIAPAAACAQPEAHDRVAFGSGVHVGPGEVVRDTVAFGGDTIIEGEVLGDAVAFGGSVVLRGAGRVHGDMTSFGGEVRDAGSVSASREIHRATRGPLERFGHWVGELVRSAVAHVLLFLLGLVLLGVARDRVGAMQVTMIRDGLETTGVGLLAYVAAVAAIVLLAITIVGIPVAVVIALALPVATYVGLAVSATVIGAALPFEKLAGREVPQLAAGVAVLFVASMVPWAGGIVIALAACLGLGALVRTRFRTSPPPSSDERGPYRTPAAV